MLFPSIFEDNFVDDLFNEAFKMPRLFNTGVSNTHMKADIKEYDDKYELSIELPGYEKKNLSAELKDGYLTLTAKKLDSKEEKDDNGKYIRRECFSGQCQRSFYVGEEVKKEDIKAKFENGILKMEVPKVKPKEVVDEAKYIDIE